jgi:serine/threonine protein kinase
MSVDPIRFGVDLPTNPMPEGNAGAAGRRWRAGGLASWAADTTTLPQTGPAVPDVAAPLPSAWRQRYTFVRTLREGRDNTLRVFADAAGQEVIVKDSPTYGRLHGRGGRIGVAKLGQLGHGSLVRHLEPPVVDDGRLWEALEYFPEGSLYQFQASISPPDLPRLEPLNPVPRELILAVVRQSADALRYLHGEQVLHTDIKPDNILIRRLPAGGYRIALTDFEHAVNLADPPRVDSTVGNTPGFNPNDDAYTPAHDWAQVGYTVLQLASGIRRPAVNLGSVDFDKLDPSLSQLVAGLLTPERLREDPQRLAHRRWGYDEIQSWLGGDLPPITGADVRRLPSRARFGFEIPFGGVTYNSPSDLALAMSREWPRALAVVQGQHGEVSYVQAIARQLAATGHPAAEAVEGLAQRTIVDPENSLVDPDAIRSGHEGILLEHLVARLIGALNPRGTPTFGVGDGEPRELHELGLYHLAADALTALPNVAHAACQTLVQLYNLRQLRQSSGYDDFRFLAALDDDWQFAVEHIDQLLRRATVGVAESRASHRVLLRTRGLAEDRALDLGREAWESHVDGETTQVPIIIRALALQCLVSDAHLDVLGREMASLLEEIGEREPWFRELAGLVDPPPAWGHRRQPPPGNFVRRAIAWIRNQWRRLRRSGVED